MELFQRETWHFADTIMPAFPVIPHSSVALGYFHISCARNLLLHHWLYQAEVESGSHVTATFVTASPLFCLNDTEHLSSPFPTSP